jgi:hypothetical protein
VVTEYDKTKRFVWTDEANTAFNDLKESICNSAKLYFVDPEGAYRLGLLCGNMWKFLSDMFAHVVRR